MIKSKGEEKHGEGDLDVMFEWQGTCLNITFQEVARVIDSKTFDHVTLPKKFSFV